MEFPSKIELILDCALFVNTQDAWRFIIDPILFMYPEISIQSTRLKDRYTLASTSFRGGYKEFINRSIDNQMIPKRNPTTANDRVLDTLYELDARLGNPLLLSENENPELEEDQNIVQNIVQNKVHRDLNIDLNRDLNRDINRDQARENKTPNSANKTQHNNSILNNSNNYQSLQNLFTIENLGDIIEVQPTSKKRKREDLEYNDIESLTTIDDEDGEVNKLFSTPIRLQPENRQIKKPRRKTLPWTEDETQAVRLGVSRFGTQWKKIKQFYSDIFNGRRTKDDIRDKYKNMTRKTFNQE